MSFTRQAGKALIVAPTYPYPIDGGNLVALHGYHMAMRSAGFDAVHFLGFEDKAHPPGSHFEVAHVVEKPPKFTAKGLARHAVGDSLLFSRYWSERLVQSLQGLASQHRYDAVLFQHGYMAQYIRSIASMLPAHCVKVASPEVLESRAFLKKAELASSPISRWALSRESRILDRVESGVFNAFDRVALFSQEDLVHYRQHGGTSQATVVNLGIEVDRYPLVPITASGTGRLRVAFFGAFSWFANTDALEYLLRDVWPVVEAKVNNVDLLIAGREIPDWAYKHQSDRVQVLGRVDSIAEFLKNVDVVLSPIRIGGGIRLKILESLAYGRTVLSTRVGLEGLDTRVVKHVRAVDTPDEYAEAINSLASDPGRLCEQAKTASELVRSIYDAKLLAELFQPLDSRSSP